MSDFQVLSGLAHVKARANGDGRRGSCAAKRNIFNGRQARKTQGLTFAPRDFGLIRWRRQIGSVTRFRP